MKMQDNNYILGTHYEELERLGLQHAVWKEHAQEAWAGAGFEKGQTIADICCGPGYASLDLAEIVGPTGKVVAIDRSENFLSTLNQRALAKGLTNIQTVSCDFNVEQMPDIQLDNAWARWAFAFMQDPRNVLEQVVSRLKEGGKLVVHEYFCWETWRMVPRCEPVEEFGYRFIKNWRLDGGEPNIGLDLLEWLPSLGCTVVSTRQFVRFAQPHAELWQWPKTFVFVGVDRLVDLGKMSATEAEIVKQAWLKHEANPNAYIVTPGLLEIIAQRKC